MLTLAFFFCNEFLVSSFGKGKSKYPSQCSLHLFPSFMRTYCVSQNEVPCFNLCGRVEAMLCHVVWDEMSDRIDSHSQTPRIRQCSYSLCISSPRNPLSTRQKDYVRINALRTSSPRTVWALCRCYWGGPQKVLNKDCWLERCGHIRHAIYTLIMHPFGKIERKNPV